MEALGDVRQNSYTSPRPKNNTAQYRNSNAAELKILDFGRNAVARARVARRELSQGKDLRAV